MALSAATTRRLSPAQQQFLLRTGRGAMEAAVRHQSLPDHVTDDPALVERVGAFVTLTAAGELRGCIGYFEPLFPLVDAVARSAVKAALDDHRFPPVSPPELGRIRIEISVLSVKSPVESLSDIEVGRDGLYIESRAARGLLLPQVATEYRWDAQTFLAHTFMKCGLSPVPIGTQGVCVYRFGAEVFSEGASGPEEP
jgi:AmmeMemoRadiSam system protein A